MVELPYRQIACPQQLSRLPLETGLADKTLSVAVPRADRSADAQPLTLEREEADNLRTVEQHADSGPCMHGTDRDGELRTEKRAGQSRVGLLKNPPSVQFRPTQFAGPTDLDLHRRDSVHH